MYDLNEINDSLFDESVEFEIGTDLDNGNDKHDGTRIEDSKKKSENDQKITIGNDFSLLKEVEPNQINFDGLGLEELGIGCLAIIQPDLHPFLNDLPWKLRYNLESLLQPLFQDNALLKIIKSLTNSKDFEGQASAFYELRSLCLSQQPRNAEALYVFALCYQFGLGVNSKIDIHNSHWNDNNNTSYMHNMLDRAGNLSDLPVANRELIEWAYFNNKHERLGLLSGSYITCNDPYTLFWRSFCQQFHPTEDQYRLQKKGIFNDYLQSAKKGDPYGQVMVGYCYEIGYFVKQNFLKALFFYNLADRQEAPFAKFRLAHLYEHLGVHQKASACYKEAAQDHFEMILPKRFPVRQHECTSKMAEERLKIMPILFEYFENRYDGLAFMVKDYLGADYSTPPRKVEFKMNVDLVPPEKIDNNEDLKNKGKSKSKEKQKKNDKKRKCILM